MICFGDLLLQGIITFSPVTVLAAAGFGGLNGTAAYL